MLCRNCNSDSYYIVTRYEKGKFIDRCNNCANLGSGFKLDGLFTRTSARVKHQQEKYAADFVQPHRYDKVSKKLVINEQFTELYPEQSTNYYTEDEAIKQGMPKLALKIKKAHQDKQNLQIAKKSIIKAAGSTKQTIKKAIKTLPYGTTK